jgi:hypothetical protein
VGRARGEAIRVVIEGIHVVIETIRVADEAIRIVNETILDVNEAIHDVNEAIHDVNEAIHDVNEAIHDVNEAIHDVDNRLILAKKAANVGFSAFFNVLRQSYRKIDGQGGTPGVLVPDGGKLLWCLRRSAAGICFADFAFS